MQYFNQMLLDFTSTPGYLLWKSHWTTQQIDQILELVNQPDLVQQIAPEDIFVTEDLKQIGGNPPMTPSLFDMIDERGSWGKSVPPKIGQKLIDDFKINGVIVNMQLIIKHPGYKITKPHQDGAYFNWGRPP